MATVPSYFAEFLSNIRLTPSQIDDLKRGHETLRNRLAEDPELSEIVVDTFLQGSYRRSTAVRPVGDQRPDVDVIVVTNIDKDKVSPDEALEMFRSFLDKHYEGKYRKQGRSWGIELSYVSLDLVPTSAPSEIVKEVSNAFASNPLELVELDLFNLFGTNGEGQTWKSEPLWIPDRNAGEWEETDPLSQIEWTWRKNERCNYHYVNVVKALKWWRINNNPNKEHPKSYPLEHLVGSVCPDDIKSVADGVTLTLENIAENYPSKPYLPDRGLDKDVFARVEEEEYKRFHEAVCKVAELARRALEAETLNDSVALWRELFGPKFPSPPSGGQDGNSGNTQVGGYSERKGSTTLMPQARYAERHA